MPLEDYNALLVEQLEGLRAAAQSGAEDAVRELLGAITAEQVDADVLARANSLLEAGDLASLELLATEQLDGLKGDASPFAGLSDIDLDDAFGGLEASAASEPAEKTEEVAVLSRTKESEVLEQTKEIEAPLEITKPIDPHKEITKEIELQARPHVLSGKFQLMDPAVIAADRERRSLAADLDRVAAQAAAEEAEEEGDDKVRKTKPGETLDLGSVRAEAQAKASERPFDSGPSQVRYAAPEPAPATHRLRSGASSEELDVSSLELDLSDAEGEGDLNFGDLIAGIEDASDANPTPQPEPEAPASEAPEEPAPVIHQPPAEPAGFDFGFDSEFDAAPDEATPPVERDPEPAQLPPEPEPAAATAQDDRDRELTPLQQLPAQDDMFIALAEQLAADSSVGIVVAPEHGHAGETNPFGVESITGTEHEPLGSPPSELVTNLDAILLEARRLRSTGELGAALDIVRKVMSRGPNREAEDLATALERDLEEPLIERCGGDLTATPQLAVNMNQLGAMDLDHRAGYLISQLDGMMSFLDLLEISGMSRRETLEVMADLVQKGAISS